jgi:hypothetical protein
MRQRRVLAMLVLALLVAAVPTAAQAKGASAATISGGGPGGLPGGPIDLAGDGEPGSGTDLSNLAEAAGVFALLWEDGAGGEDKVRQSVWPYAAGGPITYMRPGQPVLDGATRGGWYRSADNLRQTLVTLGLPNRPPLAAPAQPAPAAGAPATPAPAADPAPALWPRIALGVGLLLAVAAGGVLLLRRRSHPGAAATR